MTPHAEERPVTPYQGRFSVNNQQHSSMSLPTEEWIEVASPEMHLGNNDQGPGMGPRAEGPNAATSGESSRNGATMGRFDDVDEWEKNQLTRLFKIVEEQGENLERHNRKNMALSKENDKLKEEVATIPKLQERCNLVEADCNAMKNKSDAQASDSKKLVAQIMGLRKELELKDDKIAFRQQKIDNLRAQERACLNHEVLIRDLTATVKLQLKDLKELRKGVTEKDQTIQEMAILGLSAQKETQQHNIEFQRLNDEKNVISQQVIALMKAFKGTDATIASKDAEIEGQRGVITDLETAVEDEKLAKEVQYQAILDLKEQIKTLNITIQKQKSKINTLEGIEENMKVAYDELEAKIGNKDALLMDMQETIAKRNDELAEKQKEIDGRLEFVKQNLEQKAGEMHQMLQGLGIGESTRVSTPAAKETAAEASAKKEKGILRLLRD